MYEKIYNVCRKVVSDIADNTLKTKANQKLCEIPGASTTVFFTVLTKKAKLTVM